MTRDEARALWASSGLDYRVLTHELLHRLISLIDAELVATDLIRGYRMNRTLSLRHKAGKPIQAELRCRAFYFRSREAVTFQSDGWIGFCGWASDENAAPILEGFRKWVVSLVRDGMDTQAVERDRSILDQAIQIVERAEAASEWRGYFNVLASLRALGSTLNDGRGG
nr:hypothetical protein [uncultured Azospirillum sp.]